MIKTLKWIGLGIAGFLLIVIAIGWALNEIRPEGVEGEVADRLARRMEKSLNADAWEETGAVRWVFRGENQHLWDRRRYYAQVMTGNMEVLVNLNTREGLVFKGGEPVTGEKATEWVEDAWKMWVNDAFWLSAPFKTFDPGVSRELFVNHDGDSTLLVSYQSGGATPGDAYLWHFDETGTPDYWKMWVSILPVGGLKVPFDGWTETETGAIVPTGHGDSFWPEITNVSTTFDLSDWYTDEQDPFRRLEE